MESLKDRFFDIWENKEDHEDAEEQMAQILSTWLERFYPQVGGVDEEVAALKRDFESDLPHRVVMKAVGCDIEVCRMIRYRGDRYGVVNEYEKNDKTIPPGRRAKVYKRDDDQCVRCGATQELECHHIVPLSHGGMNHVDNMAILCKPCHKEAHAGDFSTRRTIYRDKVDFWENFANE